jgi:hypothetical protein
MKPSTLRTLLRWVHLLGAAAIGTYVYAPWRDVAALTLLLQLVVLPSLTLSGLWMWKGHLLRRAWAAGR